MKRYRGIPESPDWPHVGRVFVDVNGKQSYPLKPRHDLRNHSPDGFAWGYHGSGPAQLALAILADSVGDDLAQRYYLDFKTQCIALTPEGDWEIEEAEVLRWLVTRRETT